MSKSVSLFSALLCTFIWGTTFIAQDTGMDDIGPFTFNAVRFFVGFLAIIPLVFLFEVKKFKSQFKLDFKKMEEQSDVNNPEYGTGRRPFVGVIKPDGTSDGLVMFKISDIENVITGFVMNWEEYE